MTNKNSEKIFLNGKDLTLEYFHHVFDLKKNLFFEIEPNAKEKMIQSRKYVLDIVEKGKPVYGINTGFGALSQQNIAKEDLATLQLNLIRSHCTGVGEFLPKHLARALMLIRANCLISGHSGINPEIVELLLSFINNNIFPLIPEKGSVGASGDLAPLSHLALCLIGEGKVSYQDQVMQASDAIKKIGKVPVVLGPKDGLALINGTALMTTFACWSIIEAQKLAKLADIACAMTLDGTRGTDAAYDASVHQVRPHIGQNESAANLRLLVSNSEIRKSHKDCEKVQDAYSLRCAPQVHGAARQTIYHARDIVTTELNSVTDNPLVFPEEDKVISGGNFHGEPIAFCLDYLAIGLAEICSISERRVEKMMNPEFSSLPAFLVKKPGLNSGMMIAHVTHAALTSENKIYCHPASVDSIPTSTDKEDHVSMGPNAGNKLRKIIENLYHCLSIEFLCNTQALDLLSPKKTTEVLTEVHQLIRSVVPPIDSDRNFSEDIQNIVKLVKDNEILSLVERKLGALK